MMEEVVLGLLLHADQTIYDLKCALDNDFKMMFGSSLGCLEIVLKKLLNNKEIDYYLVTEGGRNKKKYHLTEHGKNRFFQWENEPAMPSKIKDSLLSKVYFLNEFSLEHQRQFCKQQISLLKKKYEILYSDYEQLNAFDVIQNEPYKIWLMEYQLQICKLSIRWYRKILTELKKK